MRRIALILFAVLAAVSVEAGSFEPRLDRAAERAREQGLPLLIEFGASWCAACEEMERTTWRNPQVLAALERLVPVDIDADRNPDIVTRFQVEAYPTVILATAQGHPVLELVGYRSGEQLSESLNAALGDWARLAGWAEESSRSDAGTETLIGLAEFADNQRALEQAERLYRRLLRRSSRLSSEDVVRSRLGLAGLLSRTGRCREAFRVWGRVGDLGDVGARREQERVSGMIQRCNGLLR